MSASAVVIPGDKASEQELRRTVAREPANTEAVARLAKLLLHKGLADEAVELLETAAALRPDVSDLVRRLAFALVRKGDLIAADLRFSRLREGEHQDSREELRRWMRKEAKAGLQAARAHEAGGRLQEAAAAYGLALAHAPANLEARIEFAQFLLSVGRYEGALAHLEDAPDEPRVTALRELAQDLRARSPQRRSQAFVVATYRAAQEQLMAGHAVQAEPVFRELVLSHPDYPYPWVDLRAARIVLGRPEAAEEARRQAAAASPRVRAVMEMAAARPTSARGLLFDRRDRFPLVPKEQALRRVDTPDELKASSDAYLVVDPGGRQTVGRPFFQIGEGQPAPPVQVTTAESFVIALDNALVAGRGAVITQKGELIADQFVAGKAHKYHAAVRDGLVAFGGQVGPEPPKVEFVDEPVFLCMGPTDQSYGDWLNQFPPRILLAEAAELDCRILVNRYAPPQFIEMLERLGVERRRLVFQKDGRAVIYRRLYAPSWPFDLDNRPMANWLGIYKRAVRPPSSKERPLLFLTRKHVFNRPLINEEEICELFVSHGFQEVVPERLTLSETIDLFASPACIAGPWGSAFQSTVFCHAPPVTVALMPPYWPSYMDSVGTYMHEAGVKFGYVRGENTRPDKANTSPWVISMDLAKRALDKALEMVERERTGEPDPVA